MSTERPTLKSFKGVVTTVITTDKEGAPLVKTRENGVKAPYALCGVKFTEGPLAGKTAWAQRTLMNREGVVKEPVAKGDDVSIVLVSVVDGRPFFEVATSVNATDAEMLEAFGEVTTTATAPTTADEEIPLAQ